MNEHFFKKRKRNGDAWFSRVEQSCANIFEQKVFLTAISDRFARELTKTF
jgi:hypothetical protein